MSTRSKPLLAAGMVTALLSSAPLPVGGQGLQGNVFYTDEVPVEGALVEILDAARERVAFAGTNEDGFFSLQVERPGAYYVRVSHLSVEELVEGPVQLVRGESPLVWLHVRRRAIPLDSLEVITEARVLRLENVGFYKRMRETGGLFVTPEDIEERPYEKPSDFFRTMPGITLIEGRQAGSIGNYPLTTYAMRSNLDPGRECWPRVYVDGLVVEQGGNFPPTGAFDELVRTFDLEAIEVYNSPAVVPIEYGGTTGGRCGVYLLWTRTFRGRG